MELLLFPNLDYKLKRKETKICRFRGHQTSFRESAIIQEYKGSRLFHKVLSHFNQIFGVLYLHLKCMPCEVPTNYSPVLPWICQSNRFQFGYQGNRIQESNSCGQKCLCRELKLMHRHKNRIICFIENMLGKLPTVMSPLSKS